VYLYNIQGKDYLAKKDESYGEGCSFGLEKDAAPSEASLLSLPARQR
jgi:hypothetical protein